MSISNAQNIVRTSNTGSSELRVKNVKNNFVKNVVFNYNQELLNRDSHVK